MKTLVTFDSYFGNTEKIGQAIAKAFSINSTIDIKRCREITADELPQYNLIIMGSPTRGFKPTEDVSKLIKELKPKALQKCKVAVFDTRVALETIKSKFFRKVVDNGGYAAKSLGVRLKKKGAQLIIAPEGFYVMDTQGPLKEGELERAENWGQKILEKC